MHIIFAIWLAYFTQVGVVHGPVNTQFGSHLILVLDRDE